MNELLKDKQNPPHIVYTPDSPLKNPGRLIQEMFRDLLNSRELAWRLFIRNISAQYRKTILGYLWAFLPPLVTTLTFVFLRNQQILNMSDTEIPYPVYVMIGTLLWQVFVDAMNSPLKIINQSQAMLIKIHFPREALILAGLGEVIFNFLIRMVLFIITFLWFKVPVHTSILFAPLGIIALMMMGLMFGILLTPLGILYQDVEKGLLIISSLWFFLTPIVYPVPTRWPASLLAQLNPVSPLLVTTRDWILSGQTTHLELFIGLNLGILTFIFIGWIFYRIAMPHLIARIGS